MSLAPRLTQAALIVLACMSLTAAARQGTLAHFASEQALQEWLDGQRARYEEAQKSRRRAEPPATLQMAPATAPVAAAAPAKMASESVTNVQTAGVDEGGIVKVHGDHLVVLRRGRLFTVAIAEGALAPASMADAFGPGIDPSGAWYDELLVSGDTVVVIGYSYRRGGTEIGLFDIDREGRLSHRGTYHLRSNDYYSSRNYASRLAGDKLIIYAPLYLNVSRSGPYLLPAMRKWNGDASAPFKRIAPATRIYRTDDPVDPWDITLHTVTVCDLAQGEMECRASGVMGPAGRVFYVAAESVYVWAAGHGPGGSSVFRIPLERGEPTALKTKDAPVDPMSFLESGDGFLNVLVRDQGRGEGMWSAERSKAGAMALLRVPLDLFGDGTRSAPDASYRRLPPVQGYAVQNRFVGPFLLYGTGATWGSSNRTGRHALHAVRWAEEGTVQSFSIPHGVDRIEAMGRDAIVIGTAGRDLHFSSVRLGDEASIPFRFTRADAAQGETRSHGFFYKPMDETSGLVGLPVVGGGRPGHRQLVEGSAAVTFLRNDALSLQELGDLSAKTAGAANDKCLASCADWYGNARPLFLRDRIFALLGYEIVEGALRDGAIVERRRVSFAPH